MADDDETSILRARSLGPRPALLDRPRGEPMTWDGAVRGLLSTLGVEEQPLPEPGEDGLYPNPMLMGSRRAAAAFSGLPARVTADEYRATQSVMNVATGFGDGGVAGITRRVAAPIRAYHGSPHRFDEFDIARIGSGEGAQAYGHGLYFSETEAIAKEYRDRLSDRGILLDGRVVSRSSTADRTLQERAALMVHAHGGQAEAIRAFEDLAANSPRQSWEARLLRALRKEDFTGRIEPWGGGHLYEVDLHAARDRLLDWERPLSRQPGPVREVLAERGIRPVEPVGTFEKGDQFGYAQYRLMGADGSRAVATENPPHGWMLSLYGADNRELTRRPLRADRENMADAMREMVRQDHTGRDVHRLLSNRISRIPPPPGAPSPESGVAADLRGAGVEGISYLDGASRRAGVGSQNHVAFSDEIIEILKRYGLVGMVGGGAAAGSE